MPATAPASLWIRLAASVYDVFPLIGLWMVTTALALLATHGNIDVAHPPATYQFALRAALLAVTTGYFVLSWTRGGQTIGLRAWRARVVGNDGQRVPWTRALLRFAVSLVSLLALGAGFAWCLVDPQRRAWHDLAAGTRLIRLPKS